jgi:hypothetical protein
MNRTGTLAARFIGTRLWFFLGGLLLVALMALSVHAQDTPLFTMSEQFLVTDGINDGNSSNDIALGDLDNDGDLDAITTQTEGSGTGDTPEINVIWFNDGGTFTQGNEPLGTNGAAVALGDIDNDGDLDVYIPDVLWINQGGTQGGTIGTFREGPTLQVDCAFRACEAELIDLNNDGLLDAFGNGTIYWNTGSGTFDQTPTVIAFQGGVNAIAAADLDGDTWPDVVLGGEGTGGPFSAPAQVFWNSGEPPRPTFSPGPALPTEGINDSIGIARLDNDATPDIFIATSGPNRVWLNNGDRTFREGAFVGDEPDVDVVLGDIDSDGDVDAFIARRLPIRNDDRVVRADGYWLNDGNASFTLGPNLTHFGTSRAGALGDLDGDGDLDVFLAASGPNTIWLNTTDRPPPDPGEVPTPTPEPEPAIRLVDSGQSLDPGGSFSPRSAAVLLGDVDDDSDLDAITFSGSYTTGVQVWLNQGGAQGGQAAVFASGQQIVTGPSRPGALGDIDGDGDLDLLVPRVREQGVHIWLNQNGTFTDSGVRLGSEGIVFWVELGDVDGDGDLDVVYTSAIEETVIIARNDGIAFTPGSPLTADASRLALADLDGDGDLDLLLNDDEAPVWLNEGVNTGTFIASGQTIDYVADSPVVVGDLDGDNDPDLLATVAADGAQVLLNQGGLQGASPATFRQGTQSLSIADRAIQPRTIAVGDLDGDSDIDLLVGGTSSTGEMMTIWQNNGTGRFTAGETFRGFGTGALALGDLDGDGDLDAFVAGVDLHRIFLNNEDILPTVQYEIDPFQAQDGRFFMVWWGPGNAELAVFLSHSPAVSVPLQVDFTQDVFEPREDTDVVQFGAGQTRALLTAYEEQRAGAPNRIRSPFWDSTDANQPAVITATINSAAREAAGLSLRGPDMVNIVFQPSRPDPSESACAILGFDQLLAFLTGGAPQAIVLAQEALDLDLYYALRDEVMAQSEAGRFLIDVYGESSPDLLQVAGQNADVFSQSLATLTTWRPALQALVDGEGDTVIITAEMVDSMQATLDAYEALGSPKLANTIAFAEAILDLDSYRGLTMDEALTQFEAVEFEQVYLPLVVR